MTERLTPVRSWFHSKAADTINKLQAALDFSTMLKNKGELKLAVRQLERTSERHNTVVGDYQYCSVFEDYKNKFNCYEREIRNIITLRTRQLSFDNLLTDGALISTVAIFSITLASSAIYLYRRAFSPKGGGGGGSPSGPSNSSNKPISGPPNGGSQELLRQFLEPIKNSFWGRTLSSAITYAYLSRLERGGITVRSRPIGPDGFRMGEYSGVAEDSGVYFSPLLPLETPALPRFSPTRIPIRVPIGAL